jgi:tRNA(Ile2) C34 agmatinyltransferase TiaS
MTYSKWCKRCGTIYKPTGKQNKLCKKCKEILHIRARIGVIIKSMEEIKKRLENVI